ncbi:carboxylesterase type B [Cercospora zeina]
MLRTVKSFTHIGSSKKKRTGATKSTRKDTVLETSRGALIGTEVCDTKTYLPLYRLFARVRYALPPTGERRWRKPEPLPPDWVFSDANAQPRDYRTFGNICPQLHGDYAAVDTSEWEEVVENLMHEDCLYLNIWVPAGVPMPSQGWPVQFNLPVAGTQHSIGMQQNYLDPIDIFREHREDPRLIVSANSRVGVLGYLSSEDLMKDGMNLRTRVSESAGNYGLWDLRTALQWTYDHIHLFGGNPNNIIAGGSGLITALQLHYDAFQSPENRIIKRAFLYSSAISIQPDPANSYKPNRQFDEICHQLMIATNLPGKEKVRILREVSSERLLTVVRTLELDLLPVTDGKDGFVPAWLMQSIWDGELGRRLKQRNVQVVIGDTCSERSYYEHSGRAGIATRKPSRGISSREALMSKLKPHYPRDICDELIKKYARDITDWNSVYCDIMADVQCHAAVRGFAQCLFYGGMSTQDVMRYHIAWRPKCLDEWISPGLGISQVMNVPVWFYSGWRAGFSKKDKQDVLIFTRAFSNFLKGERDDGVVWGTAAEFEVRLFSPNGTILVAEDQMWARKLDVWNMLREVQKGRDTPPADSVVHGMGSQWE